MTMMLGGRCWQDILKFFFIIAILFMGFMFSLNNLYWYYQQSVRAFYEADEDLSSRDATTKAERYFGTLDRQAEGEKDTDL